MKSGHPVTNLMKHEQANHQTTGKVFTVIFCILCCIVPLCLKQKFSAPKMLSDVKYTLSESEIVLPEVLYLSLEDATQKLESLGLQVVLKETAHNPVIPENQILTQNPMAGSVLQVGDTVVVTLSDGWSEHVPDVCNFMLEDAENTLEELGFVVDYEKQFSDSTAPDTVMSQSIAPDTELAIGSTVHLTVSKGRENLETQISETVGNYIGMDFEKAKVQLSELYLYALQADTAYYPDIPNGTIVSQDIPAGEQVPQGTSIRMTVSLGQEVASVPDCVNQNAETARSMLEEAGFYCVITYVSSNDYALDVILSQSAEAGSKLAVGSQVKLTASVGTDSYVISTGGWSGNPLPTFTTETEPESQTEPEAELLPETAPEIIEPQEPEPEIMPDVLPPDTMPEISQEYQDAPQTAPFL